MKSVLGLLVSVLALACCGAALAQTAPANSAAGAARLQRAAGGGRDRRAALHESADHRRVRDRAERSRSAGEGRQPGRSTAVHRAFGDDRQFRPGHRFRHSRHRQGRAQYPDPDRRDHLSRWRGHLSRIHDGRAIFRHCQTSNCIEARKEPSSARTPPAARCSSPPTTRRSTAAMTAMPRAIRQLQRPSAAGRGQYSDQQTPGGARRLFRRCAQQFLQHRRQRSGRCLPQRQLFGLPDGLQSRQSALGRATVELLWQPVQALHGAVQDRRRLSGLTAPIRPIPSRSIPARRSDASRRAPTLVRAICSISPPTRRSVGWIVHPLDLEGRLQLRRMASSFQSVSRAISSGRPTTRRTWTAPIKARLTLCPRLHILRPVDETI